MIDITLQCIPPRTTAQMKRVDWRDGKPRFFKSDRQEAAEHTFLSLLMPHRITTPLVGALCLTVSFTWPHLAGAPKRVRDLRLPKTTRPDADNLIKALQDCLVKLRFLEDDGQIARLVLEKFHGPSDQVGIHIQMAPIGATEAA